MNLQSPGNRVAGAPSVPCQWPTSTPPADAVPCACGRRMALVMRSYGNGSALLWTCPREGDGAWHARRVIGVAA